MTGTYLQLRFVDEDPASPAGSAHIMLGSHEISQDCGSMAELETVIKRIRADLDELYKQAARRFERRRQERTAEANAARVRK